MTSARRCASGWTRRLSPRTSRSCAYRCWAARVNLTALLKGMGKLSPEERPVVGQKVNALRSEIEDWIDERSRELAAA